ncbi:uncharacterized protein LOC115881603 [Sitophilus oryzae]|uniref:Uncharacterized protein LOC115881603 n=1 Tax=Sitophilus oryzae TaxID=7048 RepID=A0A6J2XWL6_SITOR|nr:uncharacterized protein LOC115881603 [Sitophilus oryzae]
MSDFESSDDADTDPSTLSDMDSDSDIEDLVEERIRPKNQNFFENIIPQFNRGEFIEHFRVSPAVANLIRFLTSEYYASQTGPYGKLTPLQHTYIFLWYAGHQTSSYRDVADRFCITISALFRVIKRMTYFLSNLSAEVITWPNAEEKLEIEHFFNEKNGFPGIIGIIDRTHIKIDKPEEDPESYITVKGIIPFRYENV